MGLSIWQILLVALLVLILFNRGKVSDFMGDLAKGIKSFQKGLKDEGKEEDDPAQSIEHREDAKAGEQSSSKHASKQDEPAKS